MTTNKENRTISHFNVCFEDGGVEIVKGALLTRSEDFVDLMVTELTLEELIFLQAGLTGIVEKLVGEAPRVGDGR